MFFFHVNIDFIYLFASCQMQHFILDIFVFVCFIPLKRMFTQNTIKKKEERLAKILNLVI